MNSSFQKYPPSEIPQPHGLQKYEICTASGQLATDQCYETVTDKASGATTRRRTTYYELATEDQVPKVKCSVHTGAGILSASVPIGQSPLDTPATPSQYPRATIAVDLSKVTPIPMLGPTVIGDDDPYQSVKPNMVMAATRVGDNAPPPGAANDGATTPVNVNGQAGPISLPGTAGSGLTTDGTVRIMRAQQAGALDSTQDSSTIHLDPPDPIKF
jgi:hypothetical protein